MVQAERLSLKKDFIIKDAEATRAEKKIIADTESVVEKQIHTPEGICWALPRENNGKEMVGILCPSLVSVLQRGRYMMEDAVGCGEPTV